MIQIDPESQERLLHDKQLWTCLFSKHLERVDVVLRHEAAGELTKEDAELLGVGFASLLGVLVVLCAKKDSGCEICAQLSRPIVRLLEGGHHREVCVKILGLVAERASSVSADALGQMITREVRRTFQGDITVVVSTWQVAMKFSAIQQMLCRQDQIQKLH